MAFGVDTHVDNPFAPPVWLKGKVERVPEEDANTRSFHCASCSSYVTIETWAESLRCSTCNGVMLPIDEKQRRRIKLIEALDNI